MGLFKPDLYRFFTIGFAAGALLVAGGFGALLAKGVVPVAEAQTGR